MDWKNKKKQERTNHKPQPHSAWPEAHYFVEDGDLRVPIYLDEVIGSGGESVVRNLRKSPKEITSPSKKYEGLYVAKLYNKPAPDNYVKKLRMLISIWQDHGKTLGGFCFPRHLIFNRKEGGRCVGFLMPFYTGYTLGQIFDCFRDGRLSSRMKRSLALRNIERDWTRAELAKLAIDILEKFEQLHRWGIYMCDICPKNILTNEKQEALFVDVDSYQVGNYACPVYRKEFISARLLEMDCPENELLTADDENYSIAVLLFHILFVGQHPYVRSGGEDTFEQHIANRKFAYPLTYDPASFTPTSPWLKIWYSLPFNLRECFYNAFTSDHYPDVSQWLQVMREYKENIDANRLNRSIFYEAYTMEQQSQLFLGNTWDCVSSNTTEPDKHPELRRFETVISSDSPRHTLVLEFGSDTIRSHTTSKEGIWYTRSFITKHFNCIDQRGVMDLEKLTSVLEATRLRDNIGYIPQAITHVIAFGGICLRSLTNCDAVVSTLEQVLGFPFGVLTSEEEASMLAKTAVDLTPTLSTQTTLIADVGGLATDLIIRTPDGHVARHSFPRMGSHTMTNWLYITNLKDNNLEMVFDAHDNSVDNFEWGDAWSTPPTAIVGIGALVRMLHKKENERWVTLEELERKKDELTRELTLNRRQISILYDDIKNNNQYAAKDTTLRLTLPIYIRLMRELNIPKIHILRYGLGYAYINTHFPTQQ